MKNDFKIPTSLDYYKKETWLSKHFGDKKYVKTLMKIFIPAVLQALISIIVLYVDNFALAILVPNKYEANSAKNALGLANPVINFGIFITVGWLSGITIMMSQYFGNHDNKRTSETAAFRIWTILLIMLPYIAVLASIPGKLISISSSVYEGLDFELAKIYLWVTAWTFIPYVIATALSLSLQETKRAGISFIAACVGMGTNIVLDPVFIITASNVQDAVALVAMSTGLARIVQSLFVIIYIIIKKDKWCWFFNAWKMSRQDMTKIVKNGMSVFVNETLFGLCAMILMMCLLSFNTNIHSATTNLVVIIEITNVIWPGMGSASAVLVGSELGKGDIKQAKINANRMMYWGMSFSTVMVLLIFSASLFVNPILSPDATDQMNLLAMHLEWVMLPIIWSQGIFSVSYYSIRSGGTKMVLLIDGGVMVVWSIIMASITYSGACQNMDPLLFIFCLEANQILKMIISLFVYKYYPWAKRLTHHNEVIYEDIEQYNIEGSLL